MDGRQKVGKTVEKSTNNTLFFAKSFFSLKMLKNAGARVPVPFPDGWKKKVFELISNLTMYV